MESFVAVLGVMVGAAGAAWAIVREQSLMRQLERVTAVLKDTPVDAGGARRELEHLRDHLALRMNRRYRAPRLRFDQFTAWYFILMGLGQWVLVLGATLAVVAAVVPDGPGPKIWVTVAGAVLGFVSYKLGRRVLARRERARLAWLLESVEQGNPDRSAAPRL